MASGSYVPDVILFFMWPSGSGRCFPLQSPRKHPERKTYSFRVQGLRRHVFFHAGNQGIVILSCHKCAKRNRIPLPYASSFTSLHRCTAPAGHFGHQGNAGRTPLSLFTLLPLLLTKPSLLTFAALLSLLPGERSHQRTVGTDTTLQPCPLLHILPIPGRSFNRNLTPESNAKSACFTVLIRFIVPFVYRRFSSTHRVDSVHHTPLP